MTPDELALAVERHCTSKLPDDDLLRIAALGFRGEALPSIGAVSRMRIVSRPPGADNAWEIAVEAGRKSAPVPAAHPPGTRVEVRDLFFATPARLKFLKTPRTERDLAVDAVRRLAMAYPAISFTVTGDEERVLLRLSAAGDIAPAIARRARLAALLGRDFAENSVEIDAERGGFRLSGLIGLPTLNRAAPRDQYLVVNRRPVRDKLLVGAVRGAYQDVLARDRHPMVALFLDGPAGGDRRQRPSGQGGGAVPRRGARPRADRRRVAQRARRRRASRVHRPSPPRRSRRFAPAAWRGLRRRASPFRYRRRPRHWRSPRAPTIFCARSRRRRRRAEAPLGTAAGAAARHLHPGRDRDRDRPGRPARGA